MNTNMCINRFVYLSLLCFVGGSKLPSTFHICKRGTDENEFNNCLKEAIQSALPELVNGVPSLGITSINPLHIDSITIGGDGSNAFNVLQKFKNINVYNLVNAKVDKVEAKLDNDKFETILYTSIDKCRIEAEYEFDGHVFTLPLHGIGNSVVNIEDAHSVTKLSGKIVEKKGGKYFTVEDVQISLIPKGKIKLNFGNLFNGDEILGKEMNKVINDNAKEIFEDSKKPYEEAIAVLYKKISNTVFSKVTFDELFPVSD